MKKVVNIFKMSLIIIISFIIGIKSYHANTIIFNADPNTTILENDNSLKISLKLNLPDNINFKINTYKANIKYDKNIFKDIVFINNNEWENLKYNPQNGDFIAINKRGINTSEEILKINLVLKDNISKTTKTNIIISNLEIVNTTENKIIFLNSKNKQYNQNIEITINKDEVINKTEIKDNNDSDKEIIDYNKNDNTTLKSDLTIKQSEQKTETESTKKIEKEFKEENNTNNPEINKKTEQNIQKETKNNDAYYLISIIIIIIIFIIIFHKNKKVFIFFLILLPTTIYATVLKDNILERITILEEHLINLNNINNNASYDLNNDNQIDLIDLSLLIDSYNSKAENIMHIKSEELGIGGCGMLFSPIISPFDSNTMLTISDMGGIYISHNKGENWTRKEFNGTIYTAYFDPNKEGTIYVGGSGLYKSEDNGKTFNLLFPKEENIIATPTKYESGMRYLYTTTDYPTNKVVKSNLVDPNDSKHIYVLLYYYKEGIIYESKNGGDTFEPLLTYKNNKSSNNILYDYNEIYLHNGNLRYITQDGIFEYNYNENKVQEIYISNTEIVDTEQVYENNEPYYIIIEKEKKNNSETSIKYTKDFINFTDLTDKLINDLPKTFDTYYYSNVEFNWNLKHISATSLDNIYLTQESYSTNSNYPYGIEGIIKYNGENFTWIYGNPFKNNSYLMNKAWTDGCYSLYGIAADPQNEDSLLFTTLCGVYYLKDNDTIYQRYSNVIKNDDEIEYSTNGINVQTTYGVEHNPFNENHIMLLNTDLGLITSYNNGKTWKRSNNGIKSEWLNTVYDLEFDKEKEGVVYSLWSSRHDAPYEAYSNETDNKFGGFAISYDYGKTWDSTYSSGLPKNATPVKLSIVYNKDQRIIYVATFNEGFFVSYDSGKTFNSMNNGIEKIKYNNYEYIFGADIEVVDGKIFALTAMSTYNNKTQPGKIYEWINDKWQEIKLPENTICPRDIYYHDDTLYISATSTYIFDYKTPGVDFSNYGGGIYTYKDEQINQIYDETISIAGVQIDSKGNLYTSDINGNIYLKNKEYDFKKIYSNYHSISKGIILYNDETLYLPTFGGGLLRIKISYSNT